jgi:hypothetical protein
LVTLAAAVLAAFALLGCSSTPPRQSPTTAQSTTTTATASASDFTYTLVKDLCPHVGLDHVTKILPHVEEDLHPTDLSSLSAPLYNGLKVVGCEAVLGKGGDPDVGVFTVTLEVHADATERDELNRLIWDEAVNLYKGTSIAGLGEKAVGYVDTSSGAQPNVLALDGNASLSCGWVTRYKQEANAPSPGKMLDALEQSCRDTLASLQLS